MTGWEDDGAFADGVPPVDAAGQDAERGKKGTLLVWCENCGTFVRSGDSFAGKCVRCGMPVTTMKCTRCGYKWWLRRPTLPKVCPKCCSPYYNRERVR